MVRCFAAVLVASVSNARNIPSLAFQFQQQTSAFSFSLPRRWSTQSQSALGSRVNKHNRNTVPNDVTQSSSFDDAPIQYFKRAGNNSNDTCRIAYRFFAPDANENSVTGTGTKHNSSENRSNFSKNNDKIVILLNGLLSNMSGTKSRSIQQYVNEKGAGFLCFDYQGHGSSSVSGKSFVDCTMHDWMEDARSMLDHAKSLPREVCGSGPIQSQSSKQPNDVIVVGSSMGAWIALRLAMERKDQISSVIGIGSAIDFTHHTFQKLSEEQQNVILRQNKEDEEGSLEKNHIVNISSPYLEEKYPFSNELYESGNDYLLCHTRPGRSTDDNANQNLKLSCPVRFLHGLEDDVAHWSTVTNAADVLQSNRYQGNDVTVQLLEGGDHRLSRPEDISALLDTLDGLL